MKNEIIIDSLKGGNGDIWMRLVSLYSVQKIVPYQITVYIPDFFLKIATCVFGDRLIIKTGNSPKRALVYTSLGIKNLIKPIVSGKRFIAPYAKAVIHDKKRKELKDILNQVLYKLSDSLSVIQVPPNKSIPLYQGYLELNAIKKFRFIQFEEFRKQLATDAPQVRNRLCNDIPVSNKLKIPNDIMEGILIYPTGTGRQYLPRWWAEEKMPNAFYAFFYKDPSAKIFERAGLKTIYFYEEPGDIIELAKSAGWIISTDSFPSHLLQYALSNCTITISEVLSSRIISPVFKGKIVQAVAPCHPCVHLDRGNHPLCAAGFDECINWKNEAYTNNLLSTLPVIQH